MRRNTRSFLHSRSFFKSDGIDRLVPASNREQTPLPRAYSFIAEAFSDLKVSVGLCPRAYSFIAEAFSNLKVSKGFCPPDYSFIPETFSYLKVLEGLCPSAYSFISEAFSDLKVSAGFCLPEHSFIPETFLYLKVSEGFCPPDHSFIPEAFSNLMVSSALYKGATHHTFQHRFRAFNCSITMHAINMTRSHPAALLSSPTLGATPDTLLFVLTTPEASSWDSSTYFRASSIISISAGASEEAANAGCALPMIVSIKTMVKDIRLNKLYSLVIAFSIMSQG